MCNTKSMELFGLGLIGIPVATFVIAVLIIRRRVHKEHSGSVFFYYAILTAVLGAANLLQSTLNLGSVFGIVVGLSLMFWQPVSLIALWIASDRLLLLPECYSLASLTLNILGQLSDNMAESQSFSRLLWPLCQFCSSPPASIQP